MMPIGFVLSGMLALLCTALGWHLTWRERQPPPQLPPARVICSACGGHLSGLGSYCPHCSQRLVYAVRSLETETLVQEKLKPRRGNSDRGRISLRPDDVMWR